MRGGKICPFREAERKSAGLRGMVCKEVCRSSETKKNQTSLRSKCCKKRREIPIAPKKQLNESGIEMIQEN